MKEEGRKMRTLPWKTDEGLKEIRELWSEKEIQDRVKQLAAEIASHYEQNLGWKEGEAIVVMPILDGALLFWNDLWRELVKVFPPGTLEIETFGITRYPDGYPAPGKVRIDKEPKAPVEGKHLLVVEDIVFTGDTLKELKKRLEIANPRSSTICVLIDKRSSQAKEVKFDFFGFRAEEEWWLVGYGLDWRKKMRELPWIGRLVEAKNRSS